jgi:hypothetical protein
MTRLATAGSVVCIDSLAAALVLPETRGRPLPGQVPNHLRRPQISMPHCALTL